MNEESKKKAEEIDSESEKHCPSEQRQVGEAFVGPFGIVLIMIYLIVLSIILIFSVIKLWPSLSNTQGSISSSASIIFYLWKFSISDEVRLLLIVAIAGALGSVVHALRSFYWYVGNRALKRSWLPKYILLPLVGTTLALVFYFVVRGGFYSFQTSIPKTNVFSFAAMGSLVGMFAESAASKLLQLAETIFTKTRKGEDHVEP